MRKNTLHDYFSKHTRRTAPMYLISNAVYDYVVKKDLPYGAATPAKPRDEWQN